MYSFILNINFAASWTAARGGCATRPPPRADTSLVEGDFGVF